MLVSFIVPVLNERRSLPSTISIFKEIQAEDFEVIFVDGGSNDGSKELIRDNLSRSWLLIEQKGISGVYQAINQGLKHVQAEYVVVLSANDSLDLESFSKVTDSLNQSKGWDAVFAKVEMVNKNGRVMRSYDVPSRRFLAQFLAIFGWMAPHPGTFYRSEIIRSLGGYSESFKICGDFDLFWRFMQLHPRVTTLDAVVVRMSTGGLSNNPSNLRDVCVEKTRSLASKYGMVAYCTVPIGFVCRNLYHIVMSVFRSG